MRTNGRKQAARLLNDGRRVLVVHHAGTEMIHLPSNSGQYQAAMMTCNEGIMSLQNTICSASTFCLPHLVEEKIMAKTNTNP